MRLLLVESSYCVTLQSICLPYKFPKLHPTSLATGSQVYRYMPTKWSYAKHHYPTTQTFAPTTIRLAKTINYFERFPILFQFQLFLYQFCLQDLHWYRVLPTMYCTPCLTYTIYAGLQVRSLCSVFWLVSILLVIACTCYICICTQFLILSTFATIKMIIFMCVWILFFAFCDAIFLHMAALTAEPACISCTVLLCSIVVLFTWVVWSRHVNFDIVNIHGIMVTQITNTGILKR